ncbi:hypothetical protein M9Y10_023307 [Tritrichomonas musculus]|uniref:SGF29 C-terminal domain-containing protein n=1 Tax=Tritrichomonas musculus TaxID=1915356 RepID=A0ABR2KVD0_9EUKA
MDTSLYLTLQNRITTLKSTLAPLENNGNQGSSSAYATNAELSEYRKLNDISYHNHQELSKKKKKKKNKDVLLDDGDEQWRFTTSHIPYHEGTHLIGKYTDPDGVEHSFDIIFETEDDISETQYMNCI